MISYFYSRPCGRGDLRRFRRYDGTLGISTHAPAGGATCKCLYATGNQLPISTHAPAGGATHGAVKALCNRGDISTHAPAGGATCYFNTHLECPAFLLTPLREGRRMPLALMLAASSISTHAPAGGATWPLTSPTSSARSFLLTPLREGRQQFSTSPS